ncbi:MAG: hypothetical protein GY773_01135 [Actinomycetia bacterium]|nr:hypothetical protein [Actinomycetes bacterium]
MMNRPIVLVVLAVVLLGALGLSLTGGDSEVPPEPDFPVTRVVAEEPGWTDDTDWVPNDFVRNPFDPLAEPGQFVDSELLDESAIPPEINPEAPLG